MGWGGAIVMQMSSPCPLFVAGNLISSCVAAIQTGGMLRMLLMTHTHTQGVDRLKNISFHNEFGLVAAAQGPISGYIFLGIWQDLFFCIQAARAHVIQNLCSWKMWGDSHEETIFLLNTWLQNIKSTSLWMKITLQISELMKHFMCTKNTIIFHLTSPTRHSPLCFSALLCDFLTCLWLEKWDGPLKTVLISDDVNMQLGWRSGR